MKVSAHLGISAMLIVLPLTAHAQVGGRDPTAVFDQADANKNGAVSRQEYMNARTARFGEIDRNKDGVISKADFPRAGQYPRATARVDAMIAEADTNKDGQVSKAELAKAPAPIFDRADSNRNGSVDSGELAALKASRRR